jgi:hypothetical protein
VNTEAELDPIIERIRQGKVWAFSFGLLFGFVTGYILGGDPHSDFRRAILVGGIGISWIAVIYLIYAAARFLLRRAH